MRTFKYTYFKIFPLAVLLVLMSSCCDCDEKDKKSSNKKDGFSLLDIGHDIKEIKEDLTPTPSIFRSDAKVHYGIDVSHFQGNVIEDLNPKDSLRFVICKATEGDYFIDPDFSSNWREIDQKKLIRGTYHFYQCKYDPVKQAAHFANTVGKVRNIDIAPILDIEQGSMDPSVSGDQMEKDILIFLKEVEKRLNRKPILYTDYGFAQEYLKDPAIAEYDLWLAEYSKAPKPLVPDLWKEKGYKMWQRSSSYTAYSRQIDLDVFFGELRDIVR